jgi:hypothetical protein
MHRADLSAATSRRPSSRQYKKPAAQELIQLQRLARAGVTAALLAPPDLVEHGPVLCVFRRTTGQPCPSCGLTRSWTAVAHGRVSDGFRMHPLGPLAFVGAVLLALTPRHWLERVPPYPSAVMPAFVSVWVGVWLVRLLSGSARRSGVVD